MMRERGATFVAHKLAKAINLASAVVLLIGMFLFAGPALAQTADCPTEGLLPAGSGQPPTS